MNTVAIKAEVFPGSGLFEAVSDGIDIAKRLDTPVLIDFNGCRLRLLPGDKTTDRCRQYRQWQTAGGRLQAKEPKIQPC